MVTAGKGKDEEGMPRRHYYLIFFLSWVEDTRYSLYCSISLFMPEVFNKFLKVADTEVIPK